jgi:outer membrane receptor protein involved in Fe transport
MRRDLFILASLLALAGGPAARAQEPALPEPAAPAPQPAGAPELALDADHDIDLANVVTSAAKGVTTVQEAPGIITIITADEMRQRGFHFLEDALGTLPGWMNANALGSQVSQTLVRGTTQASLLLRDGVSMFDPWGNIPGLKYAQPLETIKRVEVVTGPGGVLWGANSFLGIINVITKDAEDVNGLEVSAGYGDGPGNRQDVRAYALFGKAFFGGKLKLLQHISYENYLGPVWSMPNFIASTATPQWAGPSFYGPVSSPHPDRSWLGIVDGKLSLGPVSLYYMVPFGSTGTQATFADALVPHGRTDIYDRYVILQYKDRLLKGRFGVDVKGYWSQFNRGLQVMAVPPSTSFPSFLGPDGKTNWGGMLLDLSSQFIQRTGVTVDTDVSLPRGFKLLVGGELFYESINGSVERFRSVPYSDLASAPPGTPLSATTVGLAFACPSRQNADGSFTLVPECPLQMVRDQSRVVGALYADVQYRPVPKLTLDAGVRLQAGFGGRPYSPTPLYSGSLVWQVIPDVHLKATYATGFRAPVFNNTDVAQGGFNVAGNPKLQNESSQSFQGELNTQLFRNKAGIRLLELRADYSYTFIDKLISVVSNTYNNSGQRAVHSVEGMARLYLSGEHYVTASYTYLYSISSQIGIMRSLPSQWLSFGAVFNVISKTLDVNANLLLTGSYEDPNRVPTAQGGNPDATTSSRSNDLTRDRLPPVAMLQLGFRLRFLEQRLWVEGQLYNVLNQTFYYPDVFYDLTPSVEHIPNQAEAFHFFTKVSYHF